MKKAQNKRSSTSKNPSVAIKPFVWVITGFVVIIAAILIIDKMHEPSPTVIQRPQETDVYTSAGAKGTAPAFTLTDTAGRTKSLEEYSGKVVMLNFWATWCGPCKHEIPDFIDLQNEYRNQGFEIVGLSLDQPGEEEKVKQFVKQQGINYDVLFDDGSVAQLYGGVNSIPTTFLLNREGEIVMSKVGLQPKSGWAEAIEAVL